MLRTRYSRLSNPSDPDSTVDPGGPSADSSLRNVHKVMLLRIERRRVTYLVFIEFTAGDSSRFSDDGLISVFDKSHPGFLSASSNRILYPFGATQVAKFRNDHTLRTTTFIVH